MGGLTGDGAPKELRDAADAEESTQVDRPADDVSRETSDEEGQAERLAALRAEARSAYLNGARDKHHPDL